ncbi:rhox homeobox family member 1 [Phacochoerus africanus]|uniref:rhox homeobox family member 1 n=1 Tax=Phacochoerus africanus TaxID=41426 RepID=UPI001FD9E52A|nr:rhox homeobox family member 1 [Phacochoerus africanus]
MDPPPGRSHEDAGYLSLGVVELQDEPHGVKPTATSVAEARKAVEEDPRSELEQGAAAAAAAEQVHVGAGALDPVDDEPQKVGGGSGEETPPQQQEEASEAASEGPKPQDPQPRLHRSTFTRLQLTELESVFRRTQYPDVFARKEVAICMDVTQARVRVSEPEKNNEAGQPQ